MADTSHLNKKDKNQRRQLEALQVLGRLMLEARDSSDLRQQIVSVFLHALRCQAGSLWELAERGGAYVALAEIQPPSSGRAPVVGVQIADSGEPLLREMVNSRRPYHYADYSGEGEKTTLDSYILESYDPASLLVVPLFHFASLIGFLLLDQPDARDAFTPDDIELALETSSYSALVLESMRNRIAEGERGERMRALARLSATLTTRHDLSQVLPEIVSQGAALLGSTTCTILLVEDDESLRLAAQHGLDESSIGLQFPLTNPLVASFVQQDAPIVAEDIDRDLPQLRQMLVRDDLRSMHIFPLRVAGSVIGALTLGFKFRKRLEKAEMNLAETLASVAAGAIQNARAFELEVEQRNLLRTVAGISRRVSGILDTNWMLQEVCSMLGRELGFDYVHAFLVEEAGKVLTYTAGSKEIGKRIRASELRLPSSGDLLVMEAVRTGAPRRLVSPEAGTFLFPQAGLMAVESEIALPIIAHNHVIGALVVQSKGPDAFDAEDERLLKIVTDQISVALDNARHHSEVQAQAKLDSLTQVLNHGTFVARLHASAEQCRQENAPLSLIMLDVDEFKEYNDEFGHVAGDAALKTTVQAIRANVKSRDAVGRWGGEEFGVALVGADKEQAIGVAERIRKTLASLVPVDRLGREMPSPSVSQGIAQLDVDADDADMLVDVADKALYQAKAAGRDVVQVVGED
jgi:diguanylate cyclase (GGDEF)-like protein